MYFKVESFWQQSVNSLIKFHRLFCFLFITIIKYYGLGYIGSSCNGIRKRTLILALQHMYSGGCSNEHWKDALQFRVCSTLTSISGFAVYECEWSLVNYFVYLVFSVLIWEMGIIIVPYSWKNSLSCAGMLLPVSPNPIPAPWGNSLFSSSFYILGSNAWQLPHAHIYIVFFNHCLPVSDWYFPKKYLLSSRQKCPG